MQSLLQAIYQNEPGLLDKVKSFIDLGVDLNAVTEYGATALCAAANRCRFDVVELLLNAGADRAQLQWDDVTTAVVLGNLEEVRTACQGKDNLESVDRLSTTPYLFAIQLGDIEKAALLLALGANRYAVGFHGKTPLQHAVEGGHLPMLQWLVEQGYDIEATDDYLDTPLITAAETGKAACLEFLLAQGADLEKVNHVSDNAMGAATTLEVIDILLAHGADVNDLEPKMRAAFLGLGHNAEIHSTVEHYLRGRFTSFGQSNPDEIHDPFCLAMIRSGASAWKANKTFSAGSEKSKQATWAYDRMGRTTTILPDGRIVEIAGEHGDYYDPDFRIYNDVTVFETDGTIRIFSYPEDVFAPTDFHTATVVGDSIVFIGSLGYPKTRMYECTAVYRLDTNTFTIERIECTGDNPGWIHRHRASLDGSGCIVVTGGSIDRGDKQPFLENLDTCLLDTVDWRWTRATNCEWKQWNFVRKDRRMNHLQEIRRSILTKNFRSNDDFLEGISKLTAALGHEPDLDSVAALYLFDESHAESSPRKTRGGKICAKLHGVTVRIDEDYFGVHAVVEGILPDASIKAYQEHVLSRLARLEGVDWEVITVQ